MKPSTPPFLLFIILLLGLFLAGNVPKVYSTPTYLPGVKVGDTAQYSVTTFWYNTFPNVPVPEVIAQIQGATGMSLQITGVTADIVTATSVWTFNNGTAARTTHLQGSVADGSGNVSLFVIAGGLSPGDKIANNPISPTINYTSVGNYASSLRSLNTFNYTFSLSFVSSSIASHWERYSGLAAELSFTVNAYLSIGPVTYSEHGFSDIKMTQTSITHAPPDFTITGDPSLTIQAQAKGAIILTFEGQNGFAGKIILTAQTTPSGATVTFHPNKVNVPVDGSATTSLNITSNTAATYTVTVTASLQGQPVSHTKTETFTVTALPQPAATLFGLQPTLFYAIIGAIAAILVVGTVLALRRMRKPAAEPEAPSSAPPLQPPPSEQPPAAPPAEQPSPPPAS